MYYKASTLVGTSVLSTKGSGSTTYLLGSSPGLKYGYLYLKGSTFPWKILIGQVKYIIPGVSTSSQSFLTFSTRI